MEGVKIAFSRISPPIVITYYLYESFHPTSTWRFHPCRSAEARGSEPSDRQPTNIR